MYPFEPGSGEANMWSSRLAAHGFVYEFKSTSMGAFVSSPVSTTASTLVVEGL